MRSVTATLLSILIAAWPMPLRSQATLGTVSGIVSIDGRPLAGASLALINLETGAVHEVQSGASGAYEARVAPGDYSVSTRGPAGLAVGRGPIRIHVGPGLNAVADVDLVALPVGQDPPAQEPTPEAVPADIPADATAAPAEAPQDAPADPTLGEGATVTSEGAPQDPAASGPPQVEVEAPEGGAAIKFDKVECLIAGQYPLFNADMQPAAAVARARVFFRSVQSDEWFFVEMDQTPEGMFQGKLPRPRLDASPITYYIQSTTTAFVDSQSPEIEAIVVEDKDECRDKFLAPLGAPGPVQVFSAQSGAAIVPAGFAAGGLLTAGLIAAILGGAAAIGVGTVIINNPPPTPTPTPIPTPTPTPTPTPPTPSPSPSPSPTPIGSPRPGSPFR
jgi:hypothetical protein